MYMLPITTPLCSIFVPMGFQLMGQCVSADVPSQGCIGRSGGSLGASWTIHGVHGALRRWGSLGVPGGLERSLGVQERMGVANKYIIYVLYKHTYIHVCRIYIRIYIYMYIYMAPPYLFGAQKI